MLRMGAVCPGLPVPLPAAQGPCCHLLDRVSNCPCAAGCDKGSLFTGKLGTRWLHLLCHPPLAELGSSPTTPKPSRARWRRCRGRQRVRMMGEGRGAQDKVEKKTDKTSQL